MNKEEMYWNYVDVIRKCIPDISDEDIHVLAEKKTNETLSKDLGRNTRSDS